eukprot:m.34837 g.34837  ORF g.34837 m.34837 type:complete len:844 (-) comp17046_c0_seq1:250-2781(-)
MAPESGRSMSTFRTCFVVLFAIMCDVSNSSSTPLWRDTTASITDRVEDLIGRLSLEEKVSQLSGSAAAIPFNPELGAAVPAYSYGRECERGDVSGSIGTDYPSGLGMASMFDTEIVYEIGKATAIEVRGNVNRPGEISGASCFGPVSNLIRDSRWGRTNEMLTGEDPTLGRLLSRAFTWGIQSNPTGSNTTYRLVNTIAKHLNAYGGPEGYGYTFDKTTKRFNVNAHLSEREWREFYLPPFKGSADGGVTGFMCSYSAITLSDNLAKSNNTPACANEYLLTDIIRNEWNWDGYILSDAGAAAFTGEVEISPSAGHWHETNRTFGHGYAKSPSDAAIKTITAGMDLELTCCGAPAVFPTLVDSVNSKLLSQSILDRSLRRTLKYRFELGAMDPVDAMSHNPFNTLNSDNVSTPAMLTLAGVAADKAIVLLKNEKDMLPLRPLDFAGKVICVIGPNGNTGVNMLGGYVNQNPRFIITPFIGLQALLPSSSVRHLQGCFNDTACISLNMSEVSNSSLDECDVAVVALGLTSYAHSKDEPGDACGCPLGDAVEGECCDRRDVKLPGKQLELLQRVVQRQQLKHTTISNNNRVILFTANAGMLDLSWAKSSAGVGAILNGAYLGMSAGTALARTLFGLNNPAGRLPITYYSDISELGMLGDDYTMYPSKTSKGKTYRYFKGAPPLFPFGFGLSYSTFHYSVGAIEDEVQPCTEVMVTVAVTNTGFVDGDEVVQLYVNIANASVPTAIRQLVSFQRVFIKAGATSTVTFVLTPSDNAVMRDGDFVQVVEPGLRTLWIGASSDPAISPGIAVKYEVVGETVEVAKCDPSFTRADTHTSAIDAANWRPKTL